MISDVNRLTADLHAYPMEELNRIKLALKKENKKIYDFGVGDPKLPLWEPAIDALKESASSSLGYPSIRGDAEAKEAHETYLKERFGLESDPDRALFPTRGSKEAIFHMALSLVGRKGKMTLAYPSPGYPVYKASALFAGAIPYEVELNEENNYLVKPWTFEREVIDDLACVWVNYPHNPTGTSVDRAYWDKLVAFCHKEDVILLSDESYVDIYHSELDTEGKKELRPITPLVCSSKKVVAFFTLSKRSGFTGLRAGFMAGDKSILEAHLKARANFGLSAPLCIQKAANLTWKDRFHVDERKKELSQRLDFAYGFTKGLGLIDKKPIVPFYLWLKIPERIKKDDIRFCLDLAKDGFVATPGAWLGGKTNKHFRLSLTLGEKEMAEAFKILAKHLI